MLQSRNNCSGCSACAAICPQKAIAVKEDKEGFDYPSIDEALCIQCGLCSKVCPVNRTIKSNIETYTFVAQNINDQIRAKSSAGGVVGYVFDLFFTQGWVAYGAAYDKNNMVRHERVSSIEECLEKKIFASKYVSSIIDNTFSEVKRDLNNGIGVVFVGLPCQVAGLKSFLGKDYDKLFTIDLTCYGVPSRKLFRKYLDNLESKYNSRIVDVRFRDKVFGYSAPTMSVEFENGKVKSQNSVIKTYLRLFFSNIIIRPSCYKCHYKGTERISDITIGDCKNVHRFSQSLDDDLGTTVVYVHSIKAKELFASEGSIRIAEAPINEIVATCGKKMMECATCPDIRDQFFSEIDVLPYDELVNKYCPAKKSEIMANIVKSALLFLGLNKTSILRRLMRR